MKERDYKTGGNRIYSAADLQAVQLETLKAIEQQYAGYTDFVIQGCTVSGSGPYAVSSGLVYLDGKIRVFDAVTGESAMPRYLVPAVADEESREFDLGATKTVVKNYYAAISTTTGGGANIKLTANGPVLTIKEVMADQAYLVGDIKIITNVSGTYFDGTGKGIEGTRRWNWALCNGSNGTRDLRGRFIVGYDPTDTDYNAIGDTGGEKTHVLTESEMPSHTHTVTDPGHTHSYTDRTKQDYSIAYETGANNPTLSDDLFDTESKTTSSASTGISLGSKGGGSAHENRPPYYTLAFIQKIV